MRQYGEAESRGIHQTQKGAPGLSAAASPVAVPTGTPESFPYPFKAVMFAECARCRRALPSVPVEHGDPAEGRVSHGLCEPCAALVWEETAAYLRGLGLEVLPGGVA